MSEIAELDAELDEAEELRQAFDALTLIANRQAETIRNQREEIKRLLGVMYNANR